jgi:uncharacterized membrane protein
MKDIVFAVIVAEFGDENAADQALKSLKEERKQKAFTIKDVAIIRKDADGKLHVKETADSSGSKGAGLGLLAGGAIGLIGGPLGLIAWGATGALAGGVAAKLHDSGIGNDELRKIGAELKPESSALVVVIDPNWTTMVEKELAAAGAQVSTVGIAAEIAEKLQQAAAEKEAMFDGGMVAKEGVDAFKASTEIESRATSELDE